MKVLKRELFKGGARIMKSQGTTLNGARNLKIFWTEVGILRIQEISNTFL